MSIPTHLQQGNQALLNSAQTCIHVRSQSKTHAHVALPSRKCSSATAAVCQHVPAMPENNQTALNRTHSCLVNVFRTENRNLPTLLK